MRELINTLTAMLVQTINMCGRGVNICDVALTIVEDEVKATHAESSIHIQRRLTALQALPAPTAE